MFARRQWLTSDITSFPNALWKVAITSDSGLSAEYSGEALAWNLSLSISIALSVK